MRTRTQGIQLTDGGERSLDKRWKGERIHERLGRVSQDEAEAVLRQREAAIERRQANELRTGDEQLFRVAARKYLEELKAQPDCRTLETISGHIILLNLWVGDVRLRDVWNDTFAAFKADRLAGQPGRTNKKTGEVTIRTLKPATVNRSLEVARTILNRAARVWRTDGRPWLATAPLIEVLDEKATKRAPRPISWQEQHELLKGQPAHLERMLLFAVNTGARDENVCGLRWDWEVKVPDAGRTVFVVPASAFKGKRDHVLILNDAAWRIIERQRELAQHKEFVFVYRQERVVHLDREPKGEYRRVETMNNTAFQQWRAEVGLTAVRIHDLRHTFGQRLRQAGVSKEDRDLLLGHASPDMSQHYAASTVQRLVQQANRVRETIDRTTLLQVVNG